MKAHSRQLLERLDDFEQRIAIHGLHHDPRTRAHRALVRQRNILWANLTDEQLIEYATAIINGNSYRSWHFPLILDYFEARNCLRRLRSRRQRARRALGLPT